MDDLRHSVFYDVDRRLNVAKFLRDGHQLSAYKWSYLYNNIPVSGHSVRFYAHFIKVKLKREGVADNVAEKIKECILDLAKNQETLTVCNLQGFALKAVDLYWSSNDYKNILISARAIELGFILKYVKKYTNLNILVIFFTMFVPSIITRNYDTTITTLFILGFLFISKLLYNDKIQKEIHEYYKK